MMLNRLKLGGVALSVFRAAKTLLATIDKRALLMIVFEVVRNEIEDASMGHGDSKWRKLLTWAAGEIPQIVGAEDKLGEFVRSLVKLFNLAGVFRK